MAKQYQSITAVVNELQTGIEYQSVGGIRNEEAAAAPAAGQPIVKRYQGVPHMRRGGTFIGQTWAT